jgi:hypothetical protein
MTYDVDIPHRMCPTYDVVTYYVHDIIKTYDVVRPNYNVVRFSSYAISVLDCTSYVMKFMLTG